MTLEYFGFGMVLYAYHCKKGRTYPAQEIGVQD
jgi:hypothetical protein